MTEKFLNALRGRQDLSAGAARDPSEGCDDFGSPSAEPGGSPGPRPDRAAAAVMLARALQERGDVLQPLAAQAPVVVLRVPSGAWVDAITTVLAACVLDGRQVTRGGGRRAHGSLRRSRDVLVFARDGQKTSHHATEDNDAVTGAIQAGRPVVGISHDPARLLPRDLVRAADFTVEVGPLDGAGVSLVVEAVAGTRPRSALEDRLAALCDPADLLVFVRRDQDADASTSRLRQGLIARSGVAGGPRLEDLHGYGEAKAWGLALVDDLRRWRSGTIPFSACETGLLLSGPPGVGKTRFAMAVARSTQLNFLAGSLGQWQGARDGHLGHLLGAMRRFFEEARRQPSLMLIDEIDSFGSREEFRAHHRDYSSQVVNALLELIDGATSREGIVIIGATNHPHRLDPAIRRSGRLERHIHLGQPDADSLRGIFRHYLREDLPALDLRALAQEARGLTGADVETAVRRARGLSRRAGRPLKPEDLADALRNGRPKLGDELRWRICVHEAGHGLAAVSGGGRHTSVELSVRSTGGMIESQPADRVESPTEDDLEAYLVTALSGRAAEQVVLGDVATGSASDLAAATRCATMMETRFGFSRDFPLVTIGLDDEVDLTRAPFLIRPVADRLKASYERALALMQAERPALERLALALSRRGFLEDAEIRAIVARAPGTCGMGPEAANPDRCAPAPSTGAP
ncbi:AAA family ATPase [Methylorubrum extorquens]|uniref:AAA family ATPase n=1 Tax=Methylorubrum extorquens TaxID=408 RepID=UPI000676581C|nr:AAA family ATPase [Methylorubrum extorquens]